MDALDNIIKFSCKPQRLGENPRLGGSRWLVWVVFFLAFFSEMSGTMADTIRLLNVSYDPTREFYVDFNAAFAKNWKDKTGNVVKIAQSHGGSGKQARAVIEGLDADVVTLALGYDIDVIAKQGKMLPSDWQQHFLNKSAPYTSTIVFLVRAGNPKKIHDWIDLVKDGTEIIMANPKTSGGARWNYLAAYGAALKRNPGNEQEAQKYLEQFLKNIPVFDSGARGATTTFVKRLMGDVLMAWESEALLIMAENGTNKFELIRPEWSILAEPPVAVVDRIATKKGNNEVAEAYLTFLYSEIGQELCAKHYFRPRSQPIILKNKIKFPDMKLFTVEEMFGGWTQAHQRHFKESGLFDQITAAAAGR